MKKILLTAGVMAMLAGGAALADGARGQMGQGMGPGMMGRAMMGGGVLQTAFADIDADGSGGVSLEEFLGLAGTHFAKADSNGDGGLSAAEMTATAMAEIEARMTEMATRMVERLDKNGDGLIQSDEMPDRADPARMLEALFTRIDTNDDGTLSVEEYGAAAALMQEMGPRMGGQGMHGGDADDHGRMGGWGGWFSGRHR